MALVHKIQDKTQIPKPHWKSLNISNRNSYISKENFVKKPKWIRVKLPTGKKYTELRGLVDSALGALTTYKLLSCGSSELFGPGYPLVLKTRNKLF